MVKMERSGDMSWSWSWEVGCEGHRDDGDDELSNGSDAVVAVFDLVSMNQAKPAMLSVVVV
jgi:hypothetical protein